MSPNFQPKPQRLWRDPRVPDYGRAIVIADPRLSIIVIALNAIGLLERCLEKVAEEMEEQIEVLVVGRWSDEVERERLRASFPRMRWLAAPPDANVPLMRNLGVQHSRGELVALLEDDCLVGDGWARRVVDAHGARYVAIGGPVDPGDYKRSLDWGIYFCEYGRFMSPFSGTVPFLPGNNVAYKREELLASLDERGLYDVYLHEQWMSEGRTLLADPHLSVTNINRWSYRHATLVPFHHGRTFGAMRVAEKKLPHRFLYAAIALILPLLQPLRRLRDVLRRRRHLRHFFYALPWVVLFYSSWAFGEFLGYLTGAGGSASRWR